MPLSITLVSDIVCPGCFIGHKRLQEAGDNGQMLRDRVRQAMVQVIKRVLEVNPWKRGLSPL